jgi:hypothetical protein
MIGRSVSLILTTMGITVSRCTRIGSGANDHPDTRTHRRRRIMDTRNYVTATELKAIGYEIENYSIEVETEGHTDIYWRYKATAPDGQVIGDNLQTATEAWDRARLHFKESEEKRHTQGGAR